MHSYGLSYRNDAGGLFGIEMPVSTVVVALSYFLVFTVIYLNLTNFFIKFSNKLFNVSNI